MRHFKHWTSIYWPTTHWSCFSNIFPTWKTALSLWTENVSNECRPYRLRAFIKEIKGALIFATIHFLIKNADLKALNVNLSADNTLKLFFKYLSNLENHFFSLNRKCSKWLHPFNSSNLTFVGYFENGKPTGPGKFSLKNSVDNVPNEQKHSDFEVFKNLPTNNSCHSQQYLKTKYKKLFIWAQSFISTFQNLNLYEIVPYEHKAFRLKACTKKIKGATIVGTIHV